MVRRGKTIPELRWKDTPDFVEVAKGWNNDAITILVKLVWEGYDLLVAEILSQINCDEADEQIERSITQSLERRIRRNMTGDEPFDVQHEVYEIESSQSAQAQPPQYDIAFYLISNERIIWPLEAKVLKTDGAVGDKTYSNTLLTLYHLPKRRKTPMTPTINPQSWNSKPTPTIRTLRQQT